MINKDNYYSTIKSVDASMLPEVLHKGYNYINRITQEGETWEAYESSDTVRRVVDTFFVKLEEYLKNGETPPKPIDKPQEQAPKIPKPKNPGPKNKAKKSSANEELQVSEVERIPEELRFMRRYIAMDGKQKTKPQILSFLNSLQKAILEKRIRKTSVYAIQMRHMQDKLIKTFNAMGETVSVQIGTKTLQEFKDLIHKEILRPSISFIKRYININGKPQMKTKATALLKQLNKAGQKQLIAADDPYIEKINSIKNNLESFVQSPDVKILEIEKNELNGLNGIAGNSVADSIEESTLPKPSLMNSMDFANVRFVTIGFKSKWLKLIGDPSPGFTAMVFGKPKMGKSYLCMEFAGYLARNHGKVLYVAKEEKLDATLQKKLMDKDVAHPNLTVADGLPEDLSEYDYVILDSVQKLGLTPRDLEKLKKDYPAKSFIYIFQSTKDGNFRGVNSFQHDVDIVIEVPEKGKAVQFGRYNQGGEMDIFDKAEPNSIAA